MNFLPTTVWEQRSNNQCTTTVPPKLGCAPSTYVYDPAAENFREYDDPGKIFPEFHSAEALDITVWFPVSLLTHFTVSPALTATICGEKPVLVIFTTIVAGPGFTVPALG